MIKLNFFERRRLKNKLTHCNFRLAGEVLGQKLGGGTGENGLSQLLNRYLADPGLELALELIEYDSSLMIYFLECTPEGFYTRQSRKLQAKEGLAQAETVATTEAEESASDAFAPAPVQDTPVKRISYKAPAATPKAFSEPSPSVPASAAERRAEGSKKAREPKPEPKPIAKSVAKSELEHIPVSAAGAIVPDFGKPIPTASGTISALAEERFPNVVRTLEDSVRELQEQIGECRRQMEENPYASKEELQQLKLWMKICLDGVKEFEEAIFILKHYRGY